MNIYKATSDICDTTLFSFKVEQTQFWTASCKTSRSGRNQRTPNELGSWIKQKLH